MENRPIPDRDRKSQGEQGGQRRVGGTQQLPLRNIINTGPPEPPRDSGPARDPEPPRSSSTAAPTDRLPVFHRPGPQERMYYYSGLVGGPLVGRVTSDAGAGSSDSQPQTEQPIEMSRSEWPRSGGIYPSLIHRPHYVGKTYLGLGLFPSTDRTIIQKGRDLLLPVSDILEEHEVPWTWHTVVRIGLRRSISVDSIDDNFPPVLLINVEYGTTYEAMVKPVHAIQSLLAAHNFMVDIEVRENIESLHGARALNAPDLPAIEDLLHDNPSPCPINGAMSHENKVHESSNAAVLPLASSLGASVLWGLTRNNPKNVTQGTMGPYIRLKKKKADQLFALSAAHIFVMLTAHEQAPASVSAKSRKKRPVSQCSSEQVEAIHKVVTQFLGAFSPEAPLSFDEAAHDALLEHLQNLDAALCSLKHEAEKTSRKLREVGTLFATSDYSINEESGPHRGLLRDVAVLELNRNNFRHVANQLFVGVEELHKIIIGLPQTAEIQPSIRDLMLRTRAHNGFLPMNGEIKSLSQAAREHSGCIVLTRGSNTNSLRVGVANGVEAVTRAQYSTWRHVKSSKGAMGRGKWKTGTVGGPRAQPWNILVTPIHGPGLEAQAFSRGGDSGAAVLGLDGTWWGSVVSGSCGRAEADWRGKQKAGMFDPTPYVENKVDVSFLDAASSILETAEELVGDEITLHGFESIQRD